MQFGDRLRNLLDEKMITQKQMAKDLSIVPSTLGNYIRNLRQPDFDTLCVIADYFNVSCDYLLGHKTADIDSEALQLVQIFSKLTPTQKLIFTEQGKAFIKINEK